MIFLESHRLVKNLSVRNVPGLWIKAIGGSCCTLAAGQALQALEEWLAAQPGARVKNGAWKVEEMVGEMAQLR